MISFCLCSKDFNRSCGVFGLPPMCESTLRIPNLGWIIFLPKVSCRPLSFFVHLFTSGFPLFTPALSYGINKICLWSINYFPFWGGFFEVSFQSPSYSFILVLVLIKFVPFSFAFFFIRFIHGVPSVLTLY